MNERFVVTDASLVVKLLTPEPDTQQAVDLAAKWTAAGIRLAAPYLMLAEVSNLMLRKVLRRELPPNEAGHLLEQLASTGILFHQPIAVHARALQMAQELGLAAIYDSVYLALAEYLGCDFWTADQRFFNAANARFPQVRWIGEATTTTT